MKLFGLDWLAMLLSLLALVLLGRKNRWGFVSFMLANVTWVAAGLLLGNAAICVGNVAVCAYNLRGFPAWSRPAAAMPSGGAAMPSMRPELDQI